MLLFSQVKDLYKIKTNRAITTVDEVMQLTIDCPPMLDRECDSFQVMVPTTETVLKLLSDAPSIILTQARLPAIMGSYYFPVENAEGESLFAYVDKGEYENIAGKPTFKFRPT